MDRADTLERVEVEVWPYCRLQQTGEARARCRIDDVGEPNWSCILCPFLPKSSNKYQVSSIKYRINVSGHHHASYERCVEQSKPGLHSRIYINNRGTLFAR
jgi:hypothetical protein